MGVLMKCGCAAQGMLTGRAAVRLDPPIPYCGVHDCEEAADPTFDLSGRTAYCGCGSAEPSSERLAYFEYRGAGSREATEICRCGYHRIAHDESGKLHDKPHLRRVQCDGFTPKGPQEHDRYYCGCRGWD